MTALSRIVGAVAKLPRAETHAVKVEGDLRIPMPDGAVLLAERQAPDVPGADRLPILLVRTPYGRSGISGAVARVCAERGYQVLTVSCRGTFGSGGDWVPFRNEQTDGHAVLDWLSQQSWFSGRVGTMSASYNGLTQWAVVEDPPSWLLGWAPGATTSSFRHMVYPGGSFALESLAVWVAGLEKQESSRTTVGQLITAARGLRTLPGALEGVPLSAVDTALTGRTVDFYQDWLSHEQPDDQWWAQVDFGRRLEKVPPAAVVAGWYDLFLPNQLEDVKALTAAGRHVQLTVGPWAHSSPSAGLTLVRETLAWMDVHLKEQPQRQLSPVRVFVLGARRWVDLPSWPPPSMASRWHLHAGGGLSASTPTPGPPSCYRYDPADPTPSVGGASLHPRNSGPKDNRKLEARPDVVVFSSAALDSDVTVIGELFAELYVRSSTEHADFFIRLSDVAPNGKSTNISDGIIRLRPEDMDRQDDGSFRVRVTMFPTACTFRRGHRIRVLLAGGAHPLYARNLGSGEPLGKATTLVVVDQEILHDPEHPSALTLPVTDMQISRGRRAP